MRLNDDCILHLLHSILLTLPRQRDRVAAIAECARVCKRLNVLAIPLLYAQLDLSTNISSGRVGTMDTLYSVLADQNDRKNLDTLLSSMPRYQHLVKTCTVTLQFIPEVVIETRNGNSSGKKDPSDPRTQHTTLRTLDSDDIHGVNMDLIPQAWQEFLSRCYKLTSIIKLLGKVAKVQVVLDLTCPDIYDFEEDLLSVRNTTNVKALDMFRNRKVMLYSIISKLVQDLKTLGAASPSNTTSTNSTAQQRQQSATIPPLSPPPATLQSFMLTVTPRTVLPNHLFLAPFVIHLGPRIQHLNLSGDVLHAEGSADNETVETLKDLLVRMGPLQTIHIDLSAANNAAISRSLGVSKMFASLFELLMKRHVCVLKSLEIKLGGVDDLNMTADLAPSFASFARRSVFSMDGSRRSAAAGASATATGNGGMDASGALLHLMKSSPHLHSLVLPGVLNSKLGLQNNWNLSGGNPDPTLPLTATIPLRTLDVSSCSLLSPDFFFALPRLCPQLSELTATSAPGMIDESVKVILAQCQNLRTLNIASCQAVTSTIFDFLLAPTRKEHKLEQLILSGCALVVAPPTEFPDTAGIKSTASPSTSRRVPVGDPIENLMTSGNSSKPHTQISNPTKIQSTAETALKVALACKSLKYLTIGPVYDTKPGWMGWAALFHASARKWTPAAVRRASKMKAKSDLQQIGRDDLGLQRYMTLSLDVLRFNFDLLLQLPAAGDGGDEMSDDDMELYEGETIALNLLGRFGK